MYCEEGNIGNTNMWFLIYEIPNLYLVQGILIDMVANYYTRTPHLLKYLLKYTTIREMHMEISGAC